MNNAPDKRHSAVALSYMDKAKMALPLGRLLRRLRLELVGAGKSFKNYPMKAGADP